MSANILHIFFRNTDTKLYVIHTICMDITFCWYISSISFNFTVCLTTRNDAKIRIKRNKVKDYSIRQVFPGHRQEINKVVLDC